MPVTTRMERNPTTPPELDAFDALGPLDVPGDDAEPAPAGPPPLVVSREWQFGLIALLSKLECLRVQLVASRFSSDAAAILDHMEAMVVVTEEFSKRHDFPDASLDTQMNALAKAGAFYAAMSDLRKPEPSRGLLHSLVSKVSAADARLPGPVVRECVNLGIDTLHAHFSLFTEMYRSSIKARSWVDAASAFLADFKQMVRAFPES